MKVFSSSSYGYRMFYVLSVVITATAVFFVCHVKAADQTSPANNDPENEKIHITADMLTSDNNARVAEFSGNVIARQGKSAIKANNLKIYYREGIARSEKPSMGEASIEKLIATGNVIITFEDKRAVSQHAIYTMENRVLVLSGENSKITSGKDSVSGEKITFYRNAGRMKVESNNKKQVEAVFFSGGQGLQ